MTKPLVIDHIDPNTILAILKSREQTGSPYRWQVWQRDEILDWLFISGKGSRNAFDATIKTLRSQNHIIDKDAHGRYRYIGYTVKEEQDGK